MIANDRRIANDSLEESRVCGLFGKWDYMEYTKWYFCFGMEKMAGPAAGIRHRAREAGDPDRDANYRPGSRISGTGPG